MATYQRPKIEMTQDELALFKSQAALQKKPLARYLHELLLKGFQQPLADS